MSKFKRIGVVLFNNTEVTRNSALKLIAVLKSQAIEFKVVDKANFLQLDPSIEVLNLPQLAQYADLLLVIGGDGSMLRTATATADIDVLMSGINSGRLGFLTQIQPDCIEPEITKILQEQYTEFPHDLIKGFVADKSELALNDIVIQSQSRLIDLELTVAGNFVSRVRADGILVATPLGSTAYSLSCGGAIITPQLRCMQIVPINPHTLYSRPFIVPFDAKIVIKLLKCNNSAVQVIADGQRSLYIEENQSCTIENSSHCKFLIAPNNNFFNNLQSKMQLPN